MKIAIPENLEGKALFNFLIENKSLHYAAKKSELKKADAFHMSGFHVDSHGDISKAVVAKEDSSNPGMLETTVVMNTTFYFDSHKDVHIDGLWKKSLSENKENYHVQEHDLSFKGIITDEVKAFTRNLSWRSLSVDFPGDTQALIFNSNISKDRNEFMYNQYKKGFVKNHSVGMRYVVIELAINDEDYKEEFAVWNKYIDKIANRDEVEASGYYWAVKEAKLIEGSAVVRGSNPITPTQSVQEAKTEPSTQDEPPVGTQKEPQEVVKSFDISQLLTIF